MALNKRTYVDQETVITAQNMNDIQDEIIGNSDSIAAEYDSTATYNLSDYCKHGGYLYRCIVPISTTESWNPSHWALVAVADELHDLLVDLGSAAYRNVPATGNAGLDQVVLGSDSRLTDARNAADVYPWAKAAIKPTYTPSEVGAIPSADKGTAGGVAELDANGKVPSSQLPSYVDDVVNGYLYNGAFYEDSSHTTQITGETGKIYVDLTTNKTYRWSGSVYAEISASLALGETSSTAYRGDRGKTAYDDSQANKTNIGTMADLTTTEKGSLVGAVNELNSGKAEKVSSPTNGNFAALDANGNLKDSGHKHADYKGKQAAVSDPAASGETLSFIDSISQDSDGVITPTKKTVKTDAAPTSGSTNPVQSGGVAAAIAAISQGGVTVVDTDNDVTYIVTQKVVNGFLVETFTPIS